MKIECIACERARENCTFLVEFISSRYPLFYVHRYIALSEEIIQVIISQPEGSLALAYYPSCFGRYNFFFLGETKGETGV